MAKISMLEASKLFAVSRPTLLKHLKEGKITGEKVVKDKNEFWQIDMSELQRVYDRRDKPAPELAPSLTNTGTDAAPALQAEIKLLQAQLDAEKEARALVERHLDDLRKMLPKPQDAAPTRRWWPFSGG
jgi:hypothetical protein